MSDSEDEDDNIIIRSSWKLRHSKPIPKVQNHDGEDGEEQNVPPSPPLPPSPSLFLPRPPGKASASIFSPKRTFSAPSQLEESSSSEEEFVSLLERLKKKNIIAGASCSPKTSKGEPCFYSSFYKALVSFWGQKQFSSFCLFFFKLFLFLELNREPVISTPPVRPLSTSTSKTLKEKPQQDKTPAKNPFLKPTGSQTEPRRGPTTRWTPLHTTALT